MVLKEKKGMVKTTLSEILFPVVLQDNPRKTNREYSKVVTGIINNEEIDLNYCSPIYELIPNSEIFPKIEQVFQQNGIAYTAEYYHLNHARFYANYVIEDPRFSYVIKDTNDVIKFRWSQQHSYNGLTKYMGVAGYYRLVCSNGLTIPIKEMNEFNLSMSGKHTGSILKTLEMFDNLLNNLINSLDTVKNSITKNYEKLGGVWVEKPKDRIAEVLKSSGIIMVENSKLNTVDNILNRITSEAQNPQLGYNGKINDWLIYNGINQYINDNNLNIAAPEKRRETDTKVLEYMLKHESIFI